MSKGFNWDRVKSEDSRWKAEVQKRVKIANEKLHSKLQRDLILQEKGWSTCPKCRGGMHPAYSLCSSCRSKSIPQSKEVKKFRKFVASTSQCKSCRKNISKKFTLCVSCHLARKREATVR